MTRDKVYPEIGNGRSPKAPRAKGVDFSVAFRDAQTSKDRLEVARAWRESQPLNTNATFAFAEAAREAGLIEQAIELYRDMLRVNGDAGALGRLGELHFERGEYVQCAHYYSRLLDRADRPVWALIGAANLFERLGMFDFTLLLFLHALAEDNSHHQTLCQRLVIVFGQVSAAAKKRYAKATVSLIERLEQQETLTIKSIKGLPKVLKICRALCAGDSNVDSPQGEVRDIRAAYLPDLSEEWQAFKGVVDAQLLRDLDIRVVGINNGRLLATLRGLPDKRVTTELFADGINLGALVFQNADKRGDRGAVLTSEFELPSTLLDAHPHVYFIIVKIGDVTFQSHPQVISSPDYVIHLDGIQNGAVVGWALIRDTLSGPPLRITFEDGSDADAEFGLERVDVAQAHSGAPRNVGFSVRLPAMAARGLTMLIHDRQNGICVSRLTVSSHYSVLSGAAQEWARGTSQLHRALIQSVAPSLMQKVAGNLSVSSEFLPGVSPVKTPQDVAVIIPVYEGLEATIECIESVLSAHNATAHTIIIIEDCSPNQAIKAYLNDLEKQNVKGLSIVRRYHNGGFSEAVNVGLIMARESDVIVLNADTIVHDGWIDRLRAAALSDSNVATVTPLSNNAEICNIPYVCRPTIVHDSELALQIDRAAHSTNKGKIVDIPVAVGFCMYIKRSCINEVGMLDSATWGRGYGEEVDFCLKATFKGWRHVLALDTFVAHQGAVSFGEEKSQRIEESAAKLNDRYPFFDSVVQQFLADDPARKLRRNVILKVLSSELSSPRILHITHNYGGGTEQYVSDQVALNRLDGQTPIVLRFGELGEAGLEFRVEGSQLDGFMAGKHVESYEHNEIDTIMADLAALDIDRVHLHAPFGMPIKFLEWVVETYPTSVTIHDYAWICPRVTLTQSDSTYCGEPHVEQCNRCVKINGAHKGLRHFVQNTGEDIALYRETFRSILRRTERVIAGAEDVIYRMKRHGVDAQYQLLPHPHPPGSVFLKSGRYDYHLRKGETVRIALIGGIDGAKGFYRLVECAKYAKQHAVPAHFIVFGSTTDDEQLHALDNVTILGAYADQELERLIARHKPHVAFFPNQWPETYSYTLSHALRLGMPIVTTDLGAPAERLKNRHGAKIVSSTTSAKELVECLVATAFEQIQDL